MVALTPAGRELIDRAFTEHMENERNLLDGLTAAQQAAEREALLTARPAKAEPPPSP
ncbi:hypothetical protein ACFWIB_01420 [Streptomyces sp. NPDC127051]|uniref:hypothetical protein n=1 Tax=Streptomyces sp. NPDC127051 TaxID=3347119 RepID=UPI00364C3AAE